MNPILALIEPGRPLYDLAHDGILITDESGNIVYANGSISSLLGYPKNVLLRKNCSILNNENGLSFPEIIKDLLHNHTLTKRISCKSSDGSEIRVTVCFSLIIDQEEKPAGVFLIFKQKHQESEEDLRVLEQQSGLLHVLNYRIGEMYTIADVLTCQYLVVSLSCDKIIGWSQAEFLQGGWAFFLSLVHPEDYRPMLETYLKELELRNKEKFIHDQLPIIYQYRIRHKDGSWRALQAEGIVLSRTEDGLIRYMITFSRDITEEKMRADQVPEKIVQEFFETDLDLLLSNPEEQGSSNTFHLTAREKEILLLVKEGNSTKVISDRLELSENTINSYRKNLMYKLHARNSADLVRICMEKNLI